MHQLLQLMQTKKFSMSDNTKLFFSSKSDQYCRMANVCRQNG
jgi:hypothetical protein